MAININLNIKQYFGLGVEKIKNFKYAEYLERLEKIKLDAEHDLAIMVDQIDKYYHLDDNDDEWFDNTFKNKEACKQYIDTVEFYIKHYMKEYEDIKRFDALPT